mmetsp:Transcript_139037/g.259259  ORF Transcript_139037/g.259259 Transcript_139037/m.259259 type:complete len:93 (-) Transcript_139037:87-365(-)
MSLCRRLRGATTRCFIRFCPCFGAKWIQTKYTTEYGPGWIQMACLSKDSDAATEDLPLSRTNEAALALLCMTDAFVCMSCHQRMSTFRQWWR